MSGALRENASHGMPPETVRPYTREHQRRQARRARQRGNAIFTAAVVLPRLITLSALASTLNEIVSPFGCRLSRGRQ